jgi:hypothetical protein
MKNKTLLLFITGTLLLALIACQSRTTNPYIEIAEQSVEEQPNYALDILSKMDKKTLSAKDNAQWCLLITQARDKSYFSHTSDSIIKIAVDYYERHDDLRRLIRSYYYMGRVTQDLGNSPLAQKYYLKAFKAGEDAQDTTVLHLICNQLGMLYNYQCAYNDALLFLQKALYYVKMTKNTLSEAYILRNIARTYSLIDSLDQSIHYYKLALDCPCAALRASILQELGYRQIAAKDYAGAYTNLKESLAIAEEDEYYQICMILGRLFVETNRQDSATVYLDKSLGSNNPHTRLAAYNFLATQAKQTGQFERYKHYLISYEALHDSIDSLMETEKLGQMQAIYDYQQQELQAARTDAEKSRLARNALLGIALSLGGAFLTVSYVWYKERLQRKTDKDLAAIFERFQLNRVNETHGQIEKNLAKIKTLRKEWELSGNKNMLPLYEIRLLELENRWIEKRMEEQKNAEDDFKSSSVLLLLQNENKRGKLNSDDMERLIETVDRVFPSFKFHLANTFSLLATEDIHIIYLLKANVKKSHIAGIIHLSRQAVNNRCKRLTEEVFGEESSQKTLEQLVQIL